MLNNNYLFSGESSFLITKPLLNTVYKKQGDYLPRALSLQKVLSSPGFQYKPKGMSVKQGILSFLLSLPDFDEFKDNSLKSRFEPEDNTVDQNLLYINSTLVTFGKGLSFAAKVGRENDPNSYVYTCGSNAKGDIADPLAFRRSVENGFAHYVIKTRTNNPFGAKSEVESTYGLLANRLTLSSLGNKEVLSISAPGDNTSLYRYLTLHQVIYFHEYNGALVAVVLDSRKLAKLIASKPTKLTHTLFLDDLLAQGLVLSSIAIDTRDEEPCLLDCETRKLIKLADLPQPQTLRLGETPITIKCDQSKAILAVGKRFCFTALGQKELTESIQELGGTVPKNLSTGMLSTKKIGRAWLSDPRITDFLVHPSDEVASLLTEAHGKVPCSYARNGLRKTKVFFFESNVYDVEESIGMSCLFTAIHTLEKEMKKSRSLKRALAKSKASKLAAIITVTTPEELAEVCVKEYAEKYMDSNLIRHVSHCASYDGDFIMKVREKDGNLLPNEELMKYDYRNSVDKFLETNTDKSGLRVYVSDNIADIYILASPFTWVGACHHKFQLIEGALTHETLPITFDPPLCNEPFQVALATNRSLVEDSSGTLVLEVKTIDQYEKILGTKTVDFIVE